MRGVWGVGGDGGGGGDGCEGTGGAAVEAAPQYFARTCRFAWRATARVARQRIAPAARPLPEHLPTLGPGAGGGEPRRTAHPEPWAAQRAGPPELVGRTRLSNLPPAARTCRFARAPQREAARQRAAPAARLLPEHVPTSGAVCRCPPRTGTPGLQPEHVTCHRSPCRATKLCPAKTVA